MNIEIKTIIVQTNKSKEKNFPVGSEVVEVTGLSTKEYQQEFMSPYISASTRQTIEDKSANQLLSGLAGDPDDATIKKPAGEIKEIHLVHSKTSEEAVHLPFVSNPVHSVSVAERRDACLALNYFDDTLVVDDFMKKWPEIKTAKSIIMNLKINGRSSSMQL